MKRYAIWDKVSPIITPVGEVLSAEQWMNRYPIAKLDNITVLCAAGEINGALFGTLGQLKQRWENEGHDFSGYASDEEILQAIEDLEVAEAAVATEEEANRISNEELTAISLASIAASMEYQNMMTLPDEEEV